MKLHGNAKGIVFQFNCFHHFIERSSRNGYGRRNVLYCLMVKTIHPDFFFPENSKEFAFLLQLYGMGRNRRTAPLIMLKTLLFPLR